MGTGSPVVVDTNVLLNLATPVVDGRTVAPTGEDPFRAVLSTYDVHVPAVVLGEISDAMGSGDLLSAAAAAVMQATQHLTVHDIAARTEGTLDFGLDRGESHAIWLANDLEAEMFVTDEFNSTNYLFVALALDDRNTLFTTPHVCCHLADRDVLDPNYVGALLSYYVETKRWDSQYVGRLRRRYLDR